MIFHDLSMIFGMFWGCFGDVSGMFWGCFRDVSGMFQGCFGDVPGWFGNDQWRCFGGVWGVAPPPKYGFSPALNSRQRSCNQGGLGAGGLAPPLLRGR